MKATITDLGINGEGIAKIIDCNGQNKVCFVPFALPNEIVDITIVDTKKQICDCKLNNVIEKSNSRIVPKCKYFGVCGGCDLQHMSRELQLNYKKKTLATTIRKQIGIEPNINNIIRFNDYYYRNKMVFPIQIVDDKAIVGMYKNSTHNIVEIDECLLCSRTINNTLDFIKEYIACNGFHLFIGWKYIVIREYANSVLITVVANCKVDLKNFYNYISTKIESVGVSLIVSNNGPDILGGKYYYVAGLKSLTIEEFGIKYLIDNRGFLQVNNLIKSAIYSEILDNINNETSVIDAYSGAGLLSAIIAKKCKDVIGIEINKSASESAKNLAISNNICNVKFICGDVKNNIGAIDIKDSTIILDPPRSGCDTIVLDNINSSQATKVIYLSCNPATLARDMKKLLVEFEIVSIQPYEMFPQCKHIETLVILKRK